MPYTWQIRMCFQDTDAEGIVYHANYLKYAERARTAWISDMGLNNRDIMAGGMMLVLRHLDMDFVSPARLDDILTIDVKINEMKHASMTLTQTITCGDRVVAQIGMQLAFLSTATLRPMRLPDDMKKLFTTYQLTQGEN